MATPEEAPYAGYGVRALFGATHVAHLKIASLPQCNNPNRLTMRQREVLEWAADGKIRPGTTLKLKMRAWDKVTEKDLELAQHQVFNDTEQNFMVPIYWAADGKLPLPSLGKTAPR